MISIQAQNGPSASSVRALFVRNCTTREAPVINMKRFLQWNPIVPGVVLGFMIYLAVTHPIDWRTLLAIVTVAVWLGLAIARYFSVRARALSAPTGRRRALSDQELEAGIGRERLAAFSRDCFGGVIISKKVLSGHRPARMVRVKPEADFPFSGWVFAADREPPMELQAEPTLHDCADVLRMAPEVARYLDLPIGTYLVRTSEKTFEPDPDRDKSRHPSPQPHA